MSNPEKYTYELTADQCDLSMLTTNNAKTMRIERYDPDAPFVLVMNTMVSPDPKNNNQLFNFRNAKVSISIEADPIVQN